MLTTSEGLKLYHAFVFTFNPTNNEVEYEELVAGIRLAIKLETEILRIIMDSRLVVRQVTGTFEAKEDRMIRYKVLVLEMLASFMTFKIKQVPRGENLDADMLSKINQSTPSYISQIARVQEITTTIIEEIQVNLIESKN